MGNNLFQFENITPPNNLLESVMFAISEQKRIHKLKIHICIMLPVLAVAFVLSAYSAAVLKGTVATSGLSYYASLLFTDTQMVVQNLGSYLVLIAESTPLSTISMLLIGLLGILKASEYLFKDVDLLVDLITHKHKKYANQ